MGTGMVGSSYCENVRLFLTRQTHISDRWNLVNPHTHTHELALCSVARLTQPHTHDRTRSVGWSVDQLLQLTVFFQFSFPIYISFLFISSIYHFAHTHTPTTLLYIYYTVRRIYIYILYKEVFCLQDKPIHIQQWRKSEKSSGGTGYREDAHKNCYTSFIKGKGIGEKKFRSLKI